MDYLGKLIQYHFMCIHFFFILTFVQLQYGSFRATLQQNLYVEAVVLAGVTYATVMYNFIPGATFILAVCFGYVILRTVFSTFQRQFVMLFEHQNIDTLRDMKCVYLNLSYMFYLLHFIHILKIHIKNNGLRI